MYVLLSGSPHLHQCDMCRNIMTGPVPSSRWICTMALAAATSLVCAPRPPYDGHSTNSGASGWPVLPGELRMFPSLISVISSPKLASPKGRRKRLRCYTCLSTMTGSNSQHLLSVYWPEKNHMTPPSTFLAAPPPPLSLRFTSPQFPPQKRAGL